MSLLFTSLKKAPLLFGLEAISESNTQGVVRWNSERAIGEEKKLIIRGFP
jgi:hypothetical protein